MADRIEELCSRLLDDDETSRTLRGLVQKLDTRIESALWSLKRILGQADRQVLFDFVISKIGCRFVGSSMNESSSDFNAGGWVYDCIRGLSSDDRIWFLSELEKHGVDGGYLELFQTYLQRTKPVSCAYTH
ncbi:hypothetical protein KKD19_01410 [Patescibacteria group bacterium]|nr:hypothetical protein [Patescibacteria group bacterium]MBU4511890.1 hypothetical protein [Patescibacteria group bacterium]MCG2692858.1 hypothetical protein [Candidatus Parcubacteria bacterium]